MSEMKRIKEKKSGGNFSKEVERLVSGLYYLSESDSEIFPFTGEKAEIVNKEVILAQTKSASDSHVEERDFDKFFSPLIKIEDWFGDEEMESTRKFSALKELLQERLRDLKVFKIGNIELDIYVVGLDSENILTGIKMKAVET